MKNNNRGFAPVLVIIAVLAVLAVSGVVYSYIKNLNAPTQATQIQTQTNPNTIQLTSSDNGKTFEVTNGQIITLTLCNLGDGGYQFDTPVYDNKILSLTSHKNIPTNEKRGVVGGCYGNDVFEFNAIKVGTSNLTINASRPWDAKNKLQQFSASITVK